MAGNLTSGPLLLGVGGVRVDLLHGQVGVLELGVRQAEAEFESGVEVGLREGGKRG